MEVVSPIVFSHSGSNKRRFACSPMNDSNNNVVALDASMMLETDDHSDCLMDEGFQASKRRRKSTLENFVPSLAGRSLGCATESRFSHPLKLTELQQTLQQQTEELLQLREENRASLEQAAQHAKVEQENRILKRAVAIQQERQKHLASLLDEARRVNQEAADKIRRLEQINLTLQFQLQASTSRGNDFMRFSPQPPDVY